MLPGDARMAARPGYRVRPKKRSWEEPKPSDRTRHRLWHRSAWLNRFRPFDRFRPGKTRAPGWRRRSRAVDCAALSGDSNPARARDATHRWAPPALFALMRFPICSDQAEYLPRQWLRCQAERCLRPEARRDSPVETTRPDKRRRPREPVRAPPDRSAPVEHAARSLGHTGARHPGGVNVAWRRAAPCTRPP